MKDLSGELENENFWALVPTSLPTFCMTLATVCASAESLTGRILKLSEMLTKCHITVVCPHVTAIHYLKALWAG